jgi:trimethylamine--corrinoid protein Co-methyltransferase
MLDDECCGAALRVARGVDVDDETLALDLIKEVGFSGDYLGQTHTVRRFRREHFIPELLPREPFDVWKKAGARSALDYAKERVREILAKHQPRDVDPAVQRELNAYRAKVAERSLDEFYAYEAVEKQDFDAL